VLRLCLALEVCRLLVVAHPFAVNRILKPLYKALDSVKAALEGLDPAFDSFAGRSSPEITKALQHEHNYSTSSRVTGASG
jgi:hypothetical protein